MSGKKLVQPVLILLLVFFWVGSISGDSARKSGSDTSTAANISNEFFMANLDWSFGGKSQRGWAIYLPLICSLIKTESPIGSREFVESLSRWQKKSGLVEDGIINQSTWLKMVEHWQKYRSKDRIIPPAEKLLTLSASEFYDSERPAELRQVEQETYLAYQRMIRAAAKELNLALDENGNLAATEKYLKIISAFRSPEYQKQLRAQSPNAGRAGLAVNSPHFTGRALDLYVGGEPVSTKDANRAIQSNTKAYRWLVKNAANFGFIPYFYEPWHWEYNPQAAQ